MQSVSSRIWTRVAMSIPYNDNDYTMGTSWQILMIMMEQYNFYPGHNFGYLSNEVAYQTFDNLSDILDKKTFFYTKWLL